MARQFSTIQNFSGYVTKPDKTNTSARYLVDGSQNVLINDSEIVSVRGGYELDGASSSATTGIESAYDWRTSGTSTSELTHHLRSYDDELEWRYVDSDGNVTWTKLKDGWTNVDFDFTSFWDNSESIDKLLFVVGDSNIYEWSGAYTTIASATSNTITKNGSTTWANERFLTSGTRKVVINGTEYTYTGGESTTTLTGVTPDPSGEAADSLAFQAVRTNSNTPASGFNNDSIETLDNHVFVGSETNQLMYMSANDDFTDFTFSSPRLPSEGASFRLDSTVTGMKPQERFMYVTGGDRDWYEIGFDQLEVGSALAETVLVNKLKTGTNQAAEGRDLIATAKNAVVFVTKEPSLDELGRLENIETPQSRVLSDPIKPDFNATDFSGGHTIYYRNQQFISAPNENKVFIYDYSRGYWQPPQTMGISKFSVIGGELYGHSNGSPETYKLFTGTSDNDASFIATAKFAYRNFGERAMLKRFKDYYVEGYIADNTQLDVLYDFELDGTTASIQRTINGADSDLIFGTSGVTASLGTAPLGTEPLGGQVASSTNPKFRVIHTLTQQQFYELQVTFTTDQQDPSWSILSHGPNVLLSESQGVKIKKN